MKAAKAKPRYKLSDLISQCDLNAPEPAELAAWSAMQPAGREASYGVTDNSQSFAELIAEKQSAALRKFEYLRSLSDAERQELNERHSDLCRQIAAQIGECRRYVPHKS